MVRRFSVIAIIAFLLLFSRIIILASEYSKVKTSIINEPPDIVGANVQQIKGISIFILSTPKSEYEYLGTVSKHFAWTGGNDEMIKGLIDKAKKNYPTAQGIVFSSLDFEKGELIKFK